MLHRIPHRCSLKSLPHRALFQQLLRGKSKNNVCQQQCNLHQHQTINTSLLGTSPKPTHTLQLIRRRYDHLLPRCSQVQYTIGRSIARGIKTSARQSAPPLLAFLVLKPIAKLSAMITGRAFRQWWKALPDNKRGEFIAYLRKNKYSILAGVGALYSVCALYYYTHIKTTPITNRRRFIVFTDSQFKKIAAENYTEMMEKYKDKLVPTSHPVYKIVADVTKKLIKGNQDLPQVKSRTWKIHIVDESAKNAFVLPNGEIFVFTGILQAVDNTEQLAAVVAHEMAHVVLSHAAEQVSYTNFIDLLMILVLGGLWAFMPNDGLAIVATWFKNHIVQLLISMPYSRNLETEADEVGLEMSAKGCFDVRESEAFWEGMAVRSESGLEEDDIDDIEFLSTHPTHKNRAARLGELMPFAIEKRRMCNCPSLPKRDPMVSVERLRKKLEQQRAPNMSSSQEVILKGA